MRWPWLSSKSTYGDNTLFTEADQAFTHCYVARAHADMYGTPIDANSDTFLH